MSNETPIEGTIPEVAPLSEEQMLARHLRLQIGSALERIDIDTDPWSEPRDPIRDLGLVREAAVYNEVALGLECGTVTIPDLAAEVERRDQMEITGARDASIQEQGRLEGENHAWLTIDSAVELGPDSYTGVLNNEMSVEYARSTATKDLTAHSLAFADDMWERHGIDVLDPDADVNEIMTAVGEAATRDFRSGFDVESELERRAAELEWRRGGHRWEDESWTPGSVDGRRAQMRVVPGTGGATRAQRVDR